MFVCLIVERSGIFGCPEGKSTCVCVCVIVVPSGRLRAGEAELRLWKGEKNERTGDTVVPPNLATHPANNPQPTAVRVTLSFEPIHPGPILYPSTKEESRTSFTK